MPIGASISPIGKTIAIVALGAALSACAASSRVEGVLPSWANPQPQIVEPAQNETKITKRQAEARKKKRESQTSQAVSKPETAQQTASQGSQNSSEE